jgi:hypothetical protein
MQGPEHATSAPALADCSHALQMPDSQLPMFLRGSRLSHRSRYVSAGMPLMRFFWVGGLVGLGGLGGGGLGWGGGQCPGFAGGACAVSWRGCRM